ncbi:MAG: DNA/RNA non-specific endonuclease [Bryobacteraceae bacterium]|nr:DNA/RNA non-specific endonuclease [Bryobacteraceae bacterium]
MTNVDEIVQKQEFLKQQAEQAYAARTEQRERKLNEVEEVGVMAAAGLSSAVRRAAHMTVAEGRTLEAISGQNDSDQINFLDRGFRAAKAVCRIMVGREPFGSGFLVAPGLLLTNNHVLPDAESADEARAEFDYQLDVDDNPLTPRRFALQPSTLFITSAMTELDYTLVAVSPLAADGTPVQGYGWLPLDGRRDKVLEGEPVVIIQHPEGREKRICLFDSILVDRFDNRIHYTTDTEPGSSGSPALNRQWQVIALHHASTRTDKLHRGASMVVNEGMRISSILADLTSRQSTDAMAVHALQLISAPSTVGMGRPAPVTAGNVGGNPATPAVAAREATPTKIRLRPIEFYADRQGYNPEFLGRGSLRVPLPGLSPTLLEDTAQLADGSVELKYTHYSIAMCSSRKLAWYSACNINGATLVSLDRKDRNPDRPQESAVSEAEALALEAAGDAWFFDPRIAQTDQATAPIFDKTPFDFGHLTRRLDPVWGEPRELRLANDDTFLMTNCSPQHKQLNQVVWAALENAILDSAKRARTRMTVITGPVLDPRDPVILDIAVPVAQWKVVAFTDRNGAGPLRAIGFLRWQTRLVDDVQKSFEGVKDDLIRAKPVAIREIARMTSLDFGPLLRPDVSPRSRARPESLTESSVAEIFNEFPELA